MPALSHAYAYARAAKAVGRWLGAAACTRYERRSIFRSLAGVVAMAMAMATAVAVKVSSC